MGFARKAFVAAGVGFAVSALVGCGSSGRLLSQSQASQLSTMLNRASLALVDDRCAQAEEYLADFENKLSGLGGVNSNLVASLSDGARTTVQLTEHQCREPVAVTKPTRPHTTSATTTTRTFTQTTPKVTTPTTATVTTTTATTPTDTTPAYTYTGAVSPTTTTPTSTVVTTPTSTTVTTPPPSSGGQGLGAGSSTSDSSDTTTASGDTVTSSVTTSSGYSSTDTTESANPGAGF